MRSRSSRAKKENFDVDGAKKRLRGLRMVCEKTKWALESLKREET